MGQQSVQVLKSDYFLHEYADDYTEHGTIIMGNEPQVPYQQIISRTHNLNVVTTYLVNQLNIKAKGKNASEQIGVLPSWAKGAGAGNANKNEGGDNRKKQRY